MDSQNENAKYIRRELFRLVLMVEGGMLVIALVLGHYLNIDLWGTARINASAVISTGMGLVPMLLAFLLLIKFPVGPFARIHDFLETTIRPMFAHCHIWDLLWISMLAGFGEELFFRGVVQTLFSGWWGWAWGLGAASLLFGLAHLITPTYGVITTVIGLYLGYCFMETSNILIPIAIHGIYDFLALWFFMKQKPDLPHPPAYTDTLDNPFPE